ncbi:protein kinase domain-containing protein [Psychrobacter sp. UBA3962]|uniref:protein kinase domain-containing protein n=1 Tax=Psychrobacter sp. UBA3962 TaxID=1947352 RepID=UPI0025FBD4D4|nr:protein kinase [Psychrobacter sp. UBA3962]
MSNLQHTMQNARQHTMQDPRQDIRHQMIRQRVDSQLAQQGYISCKLLCLSYEVNENEVSYQGITKAEQENVAYIIKWQLQPTAKSYSSSLDAEIDNIKQLQQQGWQQQASYPESIQYQFIKTSIIDMQGEQWQLTGLIMPYFHLGSLKRYLHCFSLSKPQKLQLALALAKCVQQLHQIGWVHGDIKPSNFLLASSQVYLNDWACAKPILKDFGINETESKTRVQGTPAYLAPECWQGESITVQSDLYAFGITLFELWVGEKPYQLQEKELDKQKLSSQWARLHCQQPIPLLPQQWSSLQPVIDKLLAKQMRNRFDKMETVIQELQQVIKTSAEFRLY